MIIEWFVGWIRDMIDGFFGWLTGCVEWVEATCAPDSMPDFAPLFGWMATLDTASAGVVGESFLAMGTYLCIFLALFLFGLIRQVFRLIPLIGGG